MVAQPHRGVRIEKLKFLYKFDLADQHDHHYPDSERFDLVLLGFVRCASASGNGHASVLSSWLFGTSLLIIQVLICLTVLLVSTPPPT